MTIATILIIEDEAIVALDIQMRLRALGHIVVGPAANALEAKRMIEQYDPDIVLLDVELHGVLDGFPPLDQLRARSRPQIIYLTAFSDSALPNRPDATKPVARLLKPFEDRELQQALDAALGLRDR